MSETLSQAHEEDLKSNEAKNEGFEAVPYEIREKVLEALGEKEASTKVFAVFEYNKFHPNTKLVEAKEFVEGHMVAETPYGYPVWDSADSAGKFMGGVGAVHSLSTYLRDKDGEFTIPTEQLSVVWNEDGTQGGIGGGIKQWHKKNDSGELTDEVVGFVNF